MCQKTFLNQFNYERYRRYGTVVMNTVPIPDVKLGVIVVRFR